MFENIFNTTIECRMSKFNAACQTVMLHCTFNNNIAHYMLQCYFGINKMILSRCTVAQPRDFPGIFYALEKTPLDNEIFYYILQ